jgi:hypothetical protein
MRISVGKILWIALIFSAAGCQSLSRDKSKAIDQRAELIAQNEKCAREVNQLTGQAAQLSAQLETLRGFGPQRLEYLEYPTESQFGRFMRGYDANGDHIDDGIVVYLELKDRNGDTIKAAGGVEIELWDLAMPAEKGRLGRWEYPIEQMSKYWLSGIMANHYRFELPWPEGRRPEHRNVTVKLRFHCALSGNTLEIQKMIEVNIPGI